jgi:hypothetical protein
MQRDSKPDAYIHALTRIRILARQPVEGTKNYSLATPTQLNLLTLSHTEYVPGISCPSVSE